MLNVYFAIVIRYGRLEGWVVVIPSEDAENGLRVETVHRTFDEKDVPTISQRSICYNFGTEPPPTNVDDFQMKLADSINPDCTVIVGEKVWSRTDPKPGGWLAHFYNPIQSAESKVPVSR